MARAPVGIVAQVSPRGELIVPLGGPKGALGPGTRLVDARRNRVGRVSDIIGPVARPYLVVSTRERSLRLLGKELYPE